MKRFWNKILGESLLFCCLLLPGISLSQSVNFSNNFETGTNEGWLTHLGSGVSAENPRNGTYSMMINDNNQTNLGEVLKGFSPTVRGIAKFWFYYAGGQGGINILLNDEDGNEWHPSFRFLFYVINPSGQFVWRPNPPSPYLDLPIPTNIGVGIWTLIELRWDSSNNSCEVFIDGESKGIIETQYYGNTGLGKAVSEIRFQGGRTPYKDKGFFDDISIGGGWPPLASAGPDQTFTCNSPGCTKVTLDGSGSADPDGDPITYSWRENGIIIAGPTNSPTSEVALCLGAHTIKLTVDDGHGGSETDDVLITVEDSTPPQIAAAFAPVEVEDNEGTFIVQCNATDACDPNPILTAVIVVPSLIDPKIEFKVKKRQKLKIDLKKNSVKIEGPDPVGFWAKIQSGGGISVNDGQKMEIEVKAKQKYEYEFDNAGGLIEIETPQVTLLCTATDVAGNVATLTASPVFESDETDNDDDEKMNKTLVRTTYELILPEGIELLQNHPNPFNPETKIRYQLHKANNISLIVFNSIGQQIRTLVHREQQPGFYTIQWDGNNDFGLPVSSGIYFYTLRAGEFRQTRKAMLLR